jgi:hypothetical protein
MLMLHPANLAIQNRFCHTVQVVTAYRARDFDKALRLALAYSMNHTAALGSDVATRLYADRCAALLAKPPPAEWEPTLVLTEK